MSKPRIRQITDFFLPKEDTGGLDLETFLDASTTEFEITHCPPVEPPLAAQPEGKQLFEALQQSEFLYMAGTFTDNPEYLLVTRGAGTWTVRTRDFEPVPYAWIYDVAAIRIAKVWFPVVGDEKGLRLGI